MKDLVWLRPDGGEMTETEWRQSTLRAFGFRLCGDAMDEVDERGQPIIGDTLLVLLNAGAKSVPFVLPDAHPGNAWECLIDTAVAPAVRHTATAHHRGPAVARRSISPAPASVPARVTIAAVGGTPMPHLGQRRDARPVAWCL
jgi:pullulanase/glycogen debranching enzyme